LSPALLEPDLREWDLSTVPIEVLVSTLAPRTSLAQQCASTSCAIAVATCAAPPQSPDLTARLDAATATLNERVDVRVDIRGMAWWSDLATLLVLGVPVSIDVGPVPRKRHGWPTEHRTSLRDGARVLARGWGDAAQVVRESRDEPGRWPAQGNPASSFTADRTLERTDDGFELTWHMPTFPRGEDHVRVGRWREYLIWQIGSLVSAVRLPPVLARCIPVEVALTPDRWVTRWVPDRSVWPDV
jgi:hypothetical protein